MRISKWMQGLAVALCACSVLSALGCGADDDDGGAGVGAIGGAGIGGTGASGGGAAGVSAGTGGAGVGGSGMGGAAASGGMSTGGCGSESFAAIYQDIFASSTYMCSSPVCHGRMAGQSMSVGNLELMTKEVAYKELVGVVSDGMMCMDAQRTRVVPGNAAMSLLVQKLRTDTVKCGSLMPITGDSITDEELKRITDWINAGACDN